MRMIGQGHQREWQSRKRIECHHSLAVYAKKQMDSTKGGECENTSSQPLFASFQRVPGHPKPRLRGLHMFVNNETERRTRRQYRPRSSSRLSCCAGQHYKQWLVQ